jgi:hypothetical protein
MITPEFATVNMSMNRGWWIKYSGKALRPIQPRSGMSRRKKAVQPGWEAKMPWRK